jgi:CheY-like chemotaxis protein
MQLGDRPGLRHHAETISAAAQRAAGTVRNLLAFARGSTHKSGTVEINRLAHEVVTLVSRAIDRRIILTTAFDPEAGWVHGSADDLQQVLVNLILNARDAMPEGGRLRVTTRRQRIEAEEARAWDCKPGAGVQLMVEDSGCGIAREHREHIFEPFFTTKGVSKGTGLGLSIVYGTVRGLGGGIQVESEPGRGTIMRLWLPEAPAATIMKTPPPMAPAHHRILLVDDDPVVLAVVRELLNAGGCSVIPFGDPTAAAAWYAAHPGDADLALLDGNMPSLTGWQLAERLRAVRPDLPILALTGQATAEAVQAWHAAGVTHILQKPVTRDALNRELAAISLPDGSAPRPTPSPA